MTNVVKSNILHITGSDSLLSWYDIDPQPPNENENLYIVTESEFLFTLDFTNFNIDLFQQDILDLDGCHFKWWFNTVFQDWLNLISENYVDLDLDEFMYRLDRVKSRKLFLLSIVRFIMEILPFSFFDKFMEEIKNSEDNSDLAFKHRLLERLQDEKFLIDLRSKMIDFIEDEKKTVKFFINLFTKEKNSSQQKNYRLNKNFEMAIESFEFEIDQLEFFQRIIENWDSEKYARFFEQVIKNRF